MPTPSEIIDMVASLQNDTAQTVYTDAACLPYLNMALDELQEYFQQNDVSIIQESSSVITLKAGLTEVGFGTNPALPSDLIEVIEMWESISGQGNYFKMSRKEYLPHYMEGVQQNYFKFWVQHGQSFKFLPVISDIDLKLDYYSYLWQTPILIENVGVDLEAKGCKSYLGYRTAALCSAFIGENETRAQELNMLADGALSRALSIKVKPKQSIVTKRRPFRAGYKIRGYY